MGNVYRAQNVTAYIIYELNESHHFVNNKSIQNILSTVETKWQQTFGHSAFEEIVYAKEEGYTVKEVFEEYKVHGTNHITLPATEYYLQYGSFQLIERFFSIFSRRPLAKSEYFNENITFSYGFVQSLLIKSIGGRHTPLCRSPLARCKSAVPSTPWTQVRRPSGRCLTSTHHPLRAGASSL